MGAAEDGEEVRAGLEDVLVGVWVEGGVAVAGAEHGAVEAVDPGLVSVVGAVELFVEGV